MTVRNICSQPLSEAKDLLCANCRAEEFLRFAQDDAYTLSVMSDGAYGLIMAVTCILYAIVLYLRWRQGRITRKLLDSLTEEQRAKIRELLSKQ